MKIFLVVVEEFHDGYWGQAYRPVKAFTKKEDAEKHLQELFPDKPLDEILKFGKGEVREIELAGLEDIEVQLMDTKTKLKELEKTLCEVGNRSLQVNDAWKNLIKRLAKGEKIKKFDIIRYLRQCHVGPADINTIAEFLYNSQNR